MKTTKITDKMTINAAGSSIVLDGFDFTENGFLEVLDADNIVVRNCRIYGLNVEAAAKNYWFHASSSSPIKVTIENCFFGNNPGIAGTLYNLIEPHIVMEDGSGICRNYFNANCCTHNAINIYGVHENACISIRDNVFEVSAGTVRIGVKGEPVCEIDVSRNIVIANNPNYSEADAGIVTIQPYGTQTSTFANMTVRMDNNKCPSEQLIYGYSGEKDTVLTSENMPTILINGEPVNAPIYH